MSSWFGMLMEENSEMEAIADMVVPGRRLKGRPRGYVRRDMLELRITPEDVQDRNFWRSRIRAVDPHLVGKREGEEEEGMLWHN